ncbi:hypothetical protein E2C01_075958 [Portunus trituberculatus]|uniref:Uncharacterized protein n=1 Tax=Portunus trituberculatus TaxID=210409 RepID=A0A5B7IKS2_PORTR|nr:hypothetical protein [Portunus trituberculatus]
MSTLQRPLSAKQLSTAMVSDANLQRLIRKGKEGDTGWVGNIPWNAPYVLATCQQFNPRVKMSHLAAWMPLTMFPVNNGRARMGKSEIGSQLQLQSVVEKTQK